MLLPLSGEHEEFDAVSCTGSDGSRLEKSINIHSVPGSDNTGGKSMVSS